MTLLILGVLLFTLIHWFPALMPEQRSGLLARLGNPYKGLFALGIVASIVLIVLGWRSTVANPVYDTPAWGRHVPFALMPIAIWLLSSTHSRARIRRVIRHPMLLGVLVWAVAHLLANGDIRSVILFGGMAVWAIGSIVLINRRDGAWVKPDIAATVASDIRSVVIVLVVYAALMALHKHFAGVALFG